MAGLSKNPAVIKAYGEGYYTDYQGVRWRRGMDGWFDDSMPGIIHLVYDHMFVAIVEEEHPMKEEQ